MRITNELRGWAAAWWRVHLSDDGTITICTIETDEPTQTVKNIIIAMADRIDAMHEHEMTMARGEAIQYLESNASNQYIKLPVDADGLPIRIGDAMVLQHETEEKPYVVQSFTWDGEDWYFTCDEGFFNACGWEHHHEPTVEDVLREFAQCWDDPLHYAKGELVEQYAAKLRPAGDAE